MRLATRGWMKRRKCFPGRHGNSQKLAWTKIFGVLLLLFIVCLEFAPFGALQVDAAKVPKNRTAHNSTPTPTSTATPPACSPISFSPDGNPFPLCPGPFPHGGNCVWWAWEQWHLLGYDLPRNWGNAADWAVDALASGLPLGAAPRVGSIAVFPRGDGVWAFGPEGHVAFVTAVASDGMTFDVTYQNYGDPTSMYIGSNYNTDVINQPQYQNGLLRFIYFPRPIDAQLFSQLPGIGNGNSVSEITQANIALANAANTANSVALGLSPASSDQEFNTDFTGTSELLLYNRQQGTLNVLKLDQNFAQNLALNNQRSYTNLGKNLVAYVGRFGTSASDVMLYNAQQGRVSF